MQWTDHESPTNPPDDATITTDIGTYVSLAWLRSRHGVRLCAHADQDGKGMHYLEPGEVCPEAPTAQRIDAVRRHGDVITQEQRERAASLLSAMLSAAGKHGVTLDDFDWTVDLPGACVDVITAHDRRMSR